MAVLISDNFSDGQDAPVTDALIGFLSKEIYIMHRYISVRDCSCVECGAIVRRRRQALVWAAFLSAAAVFYLLLLAAALAG